VADVRLLHADEEQIDRASLAIEDGTAFIVALCPPEARNATLAYMRAHVKGQVFAEPVEMGTADEMFAALSEQVEQKNRVLSLTLGRDVLGAFDALNLHREKVLKGGPVILWLDDVETLRTMRERAPDAYSYRTTMMVIRGDGGALPQAPAEESDRITTLRKRLRRARTPMARASEAYNLAIALRTSGKRDIAIELVRSTMLTLSNVTTDDERILRALLCYELSILNGDYGKRAQSLFWSRRAEAELGGASLMKALPVRAAILASWPGPFYMRSYKHGQDGLSLINRFGLPKRDHCSVLITVAELAIAQGNLLKVRPWMQEVRALKVLSTAEEYGVLLVGADSNWRGGSLWDAERDYRIAADYAASHDLDPGIANARFVKCIATRGELDAADRLMPQAFTVLARGSVDEALLQEHEWMSIAVERQVDGDIFDVACRTVKIAVAAHDARRLSTEAIQSILSDLALAHDVIMDLSGPDGPEWYPIQLRSRRAEVLRIAGKTTEALDLLRQTLDLARKTYPDLVPETGRILVDHLLYAGQFDEALALIDEIEPIALETDFLEERARLLADRILALIGKNADADQVAPHMKALRDGMAATDSKRITAETLRHLAERLPPTATLPDPIALAEEAHRLFVAMPIPAEEARCLEMMGDALAARGNVAEAKMRYTSAKGRLERHGLLLRVPLIEEKLSRL